LKGIFGPTGRDNLFATNFKVTKNKSQSEIKIFY